MKYLVAVILSSGIALLSVPAEATIYVVNPDGTGDYATIAEAIDNAISGDVIELTAGTFTGHGNRDLSTWGKAITIRSQAGPINTVIDCEGSESAPHRGFYLNSGEGSDTVIEGITIANGYAGPMSCGGAIYLTYNSSPTILNCRFIDNFAACAGAIFCHSGSPSIQDCYFSGNMTNATGTAGAIYVGDDSAPVIEGCTFLENYAPRGGAIGCGWDGTPTFYRCVIARNSADFGGGIFCNDQAVVTMTFCTFAYNTAPDGGGIYLEEFADLSIENTIVSYSAGGMAIDCHDSGVATLTCCDVYGNEGGDYVGCIATQLGSDGNFTAIPRFCSPEVDNYLLAANSPCREDANPLCGTVGAHEVGCGDVNYVFQINPEGTGDFPTIQTAINFSANGDVVELADGTYTGDGNRDIDFMLRAITVRSQSGDPTACVIDCQGSPAEDHRGFAFQRGETANSILEGMTITNGWVTIPNCGGAMRIMANSSPIIRNCRFMNNAADCVGAVFIQWGNPNFYDCVFESNSIPEWYYAGAVFVGHNCGPGFHDCRFIDNSAPYGGAVFCRFNAIASFNDCLFAGNSADRGGAVLAQHTAAPVFNRCTFAGNSAAEGSAICVSDTSSTNLYSSIIAYGAGGAAIECLDLGEAELSVAVLWENEGGDYVGCIEDQFGYGANRLINPGFCDAPDGDYTLRANSPCAEGNNLWGRIGAFDVGCPEVINEYVLNPEGTGDFPTIQAAIDETMIGDTVTLTDGTYTGDGNRDLVYQGKSITVRSQRGEPGWCIIDCEGSELDPHKGFRFGGMETRDAVLEGVKVINGWVGPTDCGGAIDIRSTSEPTIRNCVFQGNHGACAGGMFISSHGDPYISDCEFIDNTTESYGEAGGLYIGGDSKAYIENCTFAFNSGEHGGGVSARWYAEPTLDHCVFIGNQTPGYGGGFYGWTSTHTTLRNCTFVENSSAWGGGGIAVSDSATAVLANSIIAYNLDGAAVHCEGAATASLSCCDLYGNAGGDWVGCIAGQEAIPGNISEDPIFCEEINIDVRLHSDSPCAWANNLECGYIGALPVGCGETVDVPPTDPAPSRVFLRSAPNPFNPSTVISYGIPSSLGFQPVRIAVYDTAGRLVRSLVDEDQGPGTYAVTWDGANGNGEPVAGGIYFYQLNLGGDKRTRQIVLIR